MSKINNNKWRYKQKHPTNDDATILIVGGKRIGQFAGKPVENSIEINT